MFEWVFEWVFEGEAGVAIDGGAVVVGNGHHRALLGAARVARADDDPWFGQDKALHFTLSAAIAGGGYAATVPFTDDRRWRLAVGAGLAIAAGAGKEISDRYDGGDASWRDFTWDLIGTATGLGIAWLIDRLVSTPRSRAHAAESSAP